ncbi:hypothetical protein C1X21_12600 [Pseudomonas sp. FW305-3-2-15-A-LB2]|nr:hypothetical protein C1X17_05985 [Pseudomonas sp. FW305-3-2-15-C-TSA2]PMV28986.1 hypothetical protein C1X22_12485 [Pseudomonas sp. DP16D-L5]PMV38981.1 hypothetical protein C1X21_12600 [Pseudomonas sp. FW305-3-2-15-A-LB2]PMV41016.1 hypothetical protein C1X16_25255 [Pseudomonas sp. FW305-3-2-15-C-R2A1]PMV49969.1 hypothetical protein C1X19_27270 [Pseudomonas sp. GW460-4]PMV51293.1 hypothetical protein C1X18_13450 [Pseudomonas sp. FW305-3-2-15-C-LB1]PMV63677.1 hypothetical protein C1X20_10140 
MIGEGGHLAFVCCQYGIVATNITATCDKAWISKIIGSDTSCAYLVIVVITVHVLTHMDLG